MHGDRSVLLLADESPFRRERAPLARELDLVLSSLRDEGWRPVVVTVRARWEWHDTLNSRGISADSLRTTRYSGLPIAAWKLARIVRREEPGMIHAFGPFCALISGLSRFLQPGPIRIYDRSHVSGRPRLDVGSRVAARWNDHTMARSLAVSEAARRLDRTPATKISVALDGALAPRPVDDREAARLREDLGIAQDAAVVGTIARLRPEKGHLTLFQAMRLLAPKLTQQVHLLVVGGGPYEATIHRSIQPDEPFVPHLVGHQEDVAPWFAIADVIAIPSYQDASPKAAAEALAMGKPIVASRVGGVPEQIVDGGSGLLVRAKDPEALAEALGLVLNEPELAQRLGDAGRERYASRFTLEARTERWIRCYDQVMTTRAHSTDSG